MADRRAAPVAALVLNACAWGLTWWPLRGLQAHGLHPLWSTVLVYLIAFGTFLCLRPGALPELLRNPVLWLLALAAGMTNVGFNWAVTIGDVVRVVLLFYLMPAWSVLLAWPLLGERPTPGAIVRLLVALAGVVTVLDTAGTGWPWPRALAEWLALLGGLSFAFTNILLRRLHFVSSGSRVLAMFGGGMVLATLVGLAGRVPAPPMLPAGGWALALLLAGGFLAANLLLQFGASRLPAHTTSLVMLSEVVVASLSSVALGAAELSGRTLLGGALILGAAAWSVLASRRASPS